MQADGQLKPGTQVAHSPRMRDETCTICKHSAGPLRLCTGKKGISLQQAEWQELRQHDGYVQAAVDSLLQQSAAAGLTLVVVPFSACGECLSLFTAVTYIGLSGC